MQNIFIDVLPPWVETGLQPAFYDLESGTVLQQTARMYAKVRELGVAFNTFAENVTNEVNTFEQNVNDKIEQFEHDTTETVDEYIEKFNDLHDYVHDYFDNLDVQEEINNKLDAMVEDGTLQEIITTYIQSNVAWTFDSVAEMASATNLIDGSYAQTYGYYAVGDGGGAYYVITDTQPVSGHYETLSGDLYASLVNFSSTVKPAQLGAYHDGTHDDKNALQEALDMIHNNEVKILDLEGYTYWIGSPLLLETNYRSVIKNGEINALSTFTLDGNTDNNYLLRTDTTGTTPSGETYGGYATEDLTIYRVNFDAKLTDGLGCLSLRKYLRVNVDGCQFKRYKTEGVKLSGDSHEANITNSNFIAYLGASESGLNTTGIGLSINTYDGNFTNLVIIGGKYGIYTNAQANMFDGIHIYAQTDYTIYQNSGTYCKYSNMYIDGKGIFIYQPWLTTIENSTFLIETSALFLDKGTGATVTTKGFKVIGCSGNNYTNDHTIPLLNFPHGNFTTYTECEMDLTVNNTIDNKYMCYSRNKNPNLCFINEDTPTIGINSANGIFNTSGNPNVTATAVNNFIDLTAYTETGYTKLGYVIQGLAPNTKYKILNKYNGNKSYTVFSFDDLNQSTVGTVLVAANSSQYGYSTFTTGASDYIVIGISYAPKQFEFEISLADYQD